ncbi:hypothetical protein BDK51DRAFT_39377 [Blyttiomyces helicus]|uniref:Uncharacterized protein n=1 Tax=Blyttiomyces helicus TaxID=388810 RepID=A0A4P9W7G3_9FUNG|nr:hypothetical protein BDK51DRAFT_39377 [Blyttiomyces helicus]|eukprot:RKO88401.1 hypothetical protein BDK51DRAFT_39377 [Blyttiomyces helicus]
MTSRFVIATVTPIVAPIVGSAVGLDSLTLSSPPPHLHPWMEGRQTGVEGDDDEEREVDGVDGRFVPDPESRRRPPPPPPGLFRLNRTQLKQAHDGPPHLLGLLPARRASLDHAFKFLGISLVRD